MKTKSTRSVKINDREIGDGQPTYVIAEIGINHNGELDLVRQLIDTAVQAGCDAVKFQKRTPELCVPTEQKGLLRRTPWGLISYLEYRHHIELGERAYAAIDRHCRRRNITWFASCWDVPSIEFIERFEPACYKIASACLTDRELIQRMRATGRPLFLSTGMSTMEEICQAVDILGEDNLLIAHCTSAYPCKPAELNLRFIRTLREKFNCPVGYSGHETGLQTTYAAVVLGASFVERHITLDRAMWGSDQAASVEPQGLRRLVRDIRVIEEAMGDGVKVVYDSELPTRARLRLNL